MEKIYMNDNNGSKKQKKLDSKYHFSIVLSFVVAAFAIVSLIAVGFNQVSFASPSDSYDNFTLRFYKPNGNYTIVFAKEAGEESGVPIMGSFTNGDFTNIDSFDPVFCIGTRSQEPAEGEGYSRDLSEGYSSATGNVAEGIAYILNRSNINNPNSSIIPKSINLSESDGYSVNQKYKIMEYYATQLAIWLYLHDSGLYKTDGSLKDGFSNETGYQLDIRTSGEALTEVSLYDGNIFSYITQVVNEAQTQSVKTISVNFADDNYSAVEGTNYYQTSAITVTGDPSGDLISYELSVDGIEGAFLVNDKGEEVKDYKNLSPSDKFYVRFPKDKLNSEKKTLKVTANGTFNYLRPCKYTLAGKQDLVRVENDTLVQSGYATLEIVDSPNTGLSVSKTIYFIGLIVLLCGVGIIYANSKPLKDI